jgi:hypothetical protein
MKPPWVAIQRNPISGSGARRALLREMSRQWRTSDEWKLLSTSRTGV